MSEGATTSLTPKIHKIIIKLKKVNSKYSEDIGPNLA